MAQSQVKHSRNVYIPSVEYPNEHIKHKCSHCLRLVYGRDRHREFICDVGEVVDYTFGKTRICEYFQPKKCVTIVGNVASCKLEKRMFGKKHVRRHVCSRVPS